MTKRILFHIAASAHQAQPDHREESRRALWAEAIAAARNAKEFRRWLLDEGSWEEGDDAIIF
jgi:hypothetical protein